VYISFQMKYKNPAVFIAFLLITGFTVLHAQEVMVTANGNAESSAGNVTYSVGQVAYLTKSGTDGIITEGVQQPYEITIPIGIDEKNGIMLECFIFPNPAIGYVKLKIVDHELKDLDCQLFTMNGFPIRHMKIENEETSIPMDDLSKATYLLTITENGHTLKTFQIIKN
jgi:hypothetical protein